MSKVYQIITDQILEQLDKGTIAWHKTWTGQGMPTNYCTKKEYRGINVFMLGFTEHKSSKWLTFKQAKQLKAQVRKGEKSSMVVFYKPFFAKDSSPDDERRKAEGFMLRYYRVFNTEQIDGLPAQESIDPKEFDNDPIENCEHIVNNMPTPPTIEHNEQRAYYRPSADSVNMPKFNTFTSSEEYYSTLFHELVHSTGHESRLDRKGITELNHFGSHDYTREELVAEMGASMLCGVTGIDGVTLENSASYIDGWRRKISKDIKLIITAAAQAQKAVDHIQGI